LFGLGFKFFLLQGAALVVFMTDNLIISHISDPDQVPPYNIAYRYFSVLLMLFTILSTPYWSAFTEAYQKKEFGWIRSNITGFQKIWFGLVGVAVFMVFLSNYFYDFWMGDRIEVPMLLTILFATWVCLSCSISIFSNFLSGIGKIKLSMYHAVFVMIVNIPLSIYLGKHLDMGSAGVILATIIGLIPRVIFQPIQYKKIISGRASGIWNE
jgi:O-antigen/teichoic acid export membrane protein